MKTLSFSSLCKRAVALLVLAAGLCASAKAETSSWTASYFERNTLSQQVNIDPAKLIPPIWVEGKLENGWIYFKLCTYSGTTLVCPLEITISLGKVYSQDYFYVKKFTVVDFIDTDNGRCLYSTTDGEWIRLNPTGIPVPYYGVSSVVISIKAITPDPEVIEGLKSGYIWLNPSVRETLETASLLESGASLSFSYAFSKY